jgi:hypothetical protein
MSKIAPIATPATLVPGIHGIAPSAILLVSAISLGCWGALAHVVGLF